MLRTPDVNSGFRGVSADAASRRRCDDPLVIYPLNACVLPFNATTSGGGIKRGYRDDEGDKRAPNADHRSKLCEVLHTLLALLQGSFILDSGPAQHLALIEPHFKKQRTQPCLSNCFAEQLEPLQQAAPAERAISLVVSRGTLFTQFLISRRIQCHCGACRKSGCSDPKAPIETGDAHSYSPDRLTTDI